MNSEYLILKPYGVLTLVDSNNLYCPYVLMRLKTTYHNLEIDHSVLEHPAGSDVLRRRNIIRKFAPQLSNEDMDQMAKETKYIWGEEIEIAVMRVVNDNVFPASLFNSDGVRAACNPDNGASQGNNLIRSFFYVKWNRLGWRLILQLLQHDSRFQKKVYGVTCVRARGFMCMVKK